VARSKRAVEAKVDAMLVHSSPIFVDQAAAIAELAREFRVRQLDYFPIYSKVGGLMSYGPTIRMFRQVGGIAGKILRAQTLLSSYSKANLPFILHQYSNRQTTSACCSSIIVCVADEVIE